MFLAHTGACLDLPTGCCGKPALHQPSANPAANKAWRLDFCSPFARVSHKSPGILPLFFFCNILPAASGANCSESKKSEHPSAGANVNHPTLNPPIRRGTPAVVGHCNTRFPHCITSRTAPHAIQPPCPAQRLFKNSARILSEQHNNIPTLEFLCGNSALPLSVHKSPAMADATNPPIDELYPIAVLIDELKVCLAVTARVSPLPRGPLHGPFMPLPVPHD